MDLFFVGIIVAQRTHLIDTLLNLQCIALVHFLRNRQPQRVAAIDFAPLVVLELVPNIILDANTNKSILVQLEQHIRQIKFRRALQTLLDKVVNSAGPDFIVFIARGIVLRPIQYRLVVGSPGTELEFAL